MREIPIETSLESFTDAVKYEINTAIPASIVSYDEDARTATVKVHYSDHYESEGTEPNREDWPPLPDCPVLWPRSGKFIFTWPLSKGDPVMLVFSQRSLQEWSASDGKTDIGSFLLSTHNPSDAVVMPGLSPSGNKIGETTEIKITSSNEVQIKAEKFRFGSFDAAKALAVAEKTNAELNTLKGKINEIIAAAVAGGGLVLPPPTPIATLNDVSSAKAFTND